MRECPTLIISIMARLRGTFAFCPLRYAYKARAVQLKTGRSATRSQVEAPRRFGPRSIRQNPVPKAASAEPNVRATRKMKRREGGCSTLIQCCHQSSPMESNQPAQERVAHRRSSFKAWTGGFEGGLSLRRIAPDCC